VEPPKLKLTWKTVLFPLVGVIAFFVYLFLFQVDVLSLITEAQNANPIIYSIAILFGLVEVLFYTISWRTLTKHLSIKMSIKRAYLYVWYGLYIDIIVPAESISGEIARTYLLTRDRCGPCGKIVASLYTHRLIGMAMNVVILVMGMAFLSFEGQVSPLVFNLILFVSVSITLVLCLMVVFSFKQRWILKIIDWTKKLATFVSRGRWTLEKFKEEATNITSSFNEAMKEFRHNPKPIAVSTFHMALTWVFSLSIPYLVFLSLGYAVPWSLILVTSAIVLAVKSIPLGIPFEVGLPEIVMTTLFASFLEPALGLQVAAGISATATILTRIITLWFRFFIGFAAQQWLELKPVMSLTEKTKT
jgi:uncharacterized protein (TIRG00374 family)